MSLRDRITAYGWPLAVILLVWLWMFREVLFAPNLFVYRDTAHFYHPLFSQVHAEWAAGRVPLWTTAENCGQPLLANPTASVLYPGKLIFWLGLPFDTAFVGYITLHVLLAAIAAWRLARTLGASTTGAGLAALSYAFCGNVVFQHCNVVFLCGAAWLPLALECGHTMLTRTSPLHAAGLGAVLALMALAGDPQMGYVGGLLVALEAVCLALRGGAASPVAAEDAATRPKRQRGAKPDARPAAFGRLRAFARRPDVLLLFQGAVWAFLLAAVQILPTTEFRRESVRALADVPRNLYEVPGYLWRPSQPSALQLAPGAPRPSWYAGLIGKPPPPAAHHTQIYEFSVGPWRLVEFLWPNVSGRQFPTNRRWLEVLSSEAAIWVPSFYMGLFPILLVLAHWRWRPNDGVALWLQTSVALMVVASFGLFGLGWLLRQLAGSSPVGDEVGGVYWLCTLLLPGFAEFRFPGKMLVPAALGLSLLAAQGWDAWQAGERPRLTRWLLVFGTISGCLAVGLWLLGSVLADRWHAWMALIEPDGYFGPVDAAGAWTDLRGGFTQAALAAGLLWCVLRWFPGRPRLQGWSGAAVLVLTAIDLACANSWMIATAPAELWHRPSQVAELIRAAEEEAGEAPGGAPCVYRLASWHPPAWGETIDPQRQAAGLRWDRDTLFPKYNMPLGLPVVSVSGTMELYDYELFWQTSFRDDGHGGTEFVQPRRAADLWGAKYFVLPTTSHPDYQFQTLVGLETAWLEPQWTADRPQGAPQGPPLAPAVSEPARWLAEVPAVQVLRNPSAFPRAWIVHHITAAPPLDRRDKAQVNGVMQAILFPIDQWLDLRRTALVEDPDILAAAPQGALEFPSNPAVESCRVVDEDPQRVVLEARLASPGVVVLADVYYPGWEVSVENLDPASPATAETSLVLRTNRMMRGAFLLPGHYRLTYVYRPWSFYLGAAISVLAWLGLGVAGVMWRIAPFMGPKEGSLLGAAASRGGADAGTSAG